MREISLPAVCGPACPLYSLKNHKCIYSGKERKANEKCEFGFTVKEAKEKIEEAKS